MKKENRLKRLQNTIDECRLDEENFDYLYKKLKEEYKKECAINENSIFANNLKQTITKEAHYYIVARKKNPSKRHINEYNNFVSNFMSDVQVWGMK
jgi:CRISPR/Cas system-associated endoribonuclease Cas2